MSDFTAADHVTEREVGSRWEDCTFASMLETMRLGLPHGRSIPATEAEKERFRAAAGFPDNHAGARIDQTLTAAHQLYGLSDDDYTLTSDWLTLASLLEDPEVVCAVTGLMGALPATVHRWDTFTGPHCVAKHGVRVLCDPLAPKDGKYRGEEVNLSGWRAYFDALPYPQAFVMRLAQEEPMAIYVQDERSGGFVIKAKTTAHGYLPASDGAGWSVVKTWNPKPADSSARFDAHLARMSGSMTPSSLLHVVTGTFAGMFIDTAEVVETFDLAPNSATS
jgi:hypothetical protein